MKRTSAQLRKQSAKRQQTLRAKDTARRQPVGKIGEMKYMDSDAAITLAAVTTTWVAGTIVDPLTTINLGSAAVANPLCLCAPTVGAALNQRVGRKIVIHKVKVHGTISVAQQAGQAASDASTKIRIVLVQDCQTNAAQMTGAQLFNDATAAATTINTFQNPNNFGRFRVWKDKMITLSNLNMTGNPSTPDVIQASIRRDFKLTVNFKTPIEVHFNATNGGTVADIVDNSFHIVCGAETIAYAPVINYYSRVCYKDV